MYRDAGSVVVGQGVDAGGFTFQNSSSCLTFLGESSSDAVVVRRAYRRCGKQPSPSDVLAASSAVGNTKGL